MSIVNDALKKASKDFEFNDQKISIGDGRGRPLQSSDKKWTALITVSLVIVAVLFGSLFLYKAITGFNSSNSSDGEIAKPAFAIQSTLNSIEQKNIVKAIRPKDAMKLNGILYGDRGGLAIVNDKIVKEGDTLPGGEITSITKDFVKIEKKDGTITVLSLK